MKKLLFAALAILGFSTATLAQVAPAVKQAATDKKMEVVKKVAPAKVVAMDKAKQAAVAPVKAGTGVVLKADGTPDKRYKNAGDAKVPLKKDGTPDKRFKANK